MKKLEKKINKLTSAFFFKCGLLITVISLFIINISRYWNNYTIKNQTIVGANIGAGAIGLLGILLCLIGIVFLISSIVLFILKQLKS